MGYSQELQTQTQSRLRNRQYRETWLYWLGNSSGFRCLPWVYCNLLLCVFVACIRRRTGAPCGFLYILSGYYHLKILIKTLFEIRGMNFFVWMKSFEAFKKRKNVSKLFWKANLIKGESLFRSSEEILKVDQEMLFHGSCINAKAYCFSTESWFVQTSGAKRLLLRLF